MNECIIRNLCDGSRDYPLKSVNSIYLGSKGRSTGRLRVRTEDISEAIRLDESKGLLMIEVSQKKDQ